MNDYDSNSQMDPLLLPFLQTGDQREEQHELNRLVADAAPVIKKITSSGRAPEDAFQETTQQVIRQLRELKAHPGEKAISNYRHYVRVIASHVIKGQVRQEHPRYRSLADALRHALKRESSLALWKIENQERLCGLAAWRDSQMDLKHSERLIRLLDDPRTFEEVVPGQDPRSLRHSDLLAELFKWLGHPIRFDELVRVVYHLKGIETFTLVVEDEEEGRLLSDRLPDAGWRPDEQAEWSEFLEQLWAQIEQLPPFQRVAYLLNFTATDGQLELFWSYGIAGIRRIGAALQLTDEQFVQLWRELALNDNEHRRALALESYDEKFALLWQHLPLTDAVIAKILGTERQKVINLRKAAGDRLSRRLTHHCRKTRT
jgi:hypothetical protein